MSTTTTLPALQQAFHATEKSILGRTVERHVQTRTMLLALPARLHHFQYGLPGTGKSFIVDLLVQHIGDLPSDRYFKSNGHPQKPESELFGMLDPSGIDKGIRRRNLDRTLATANVAFITEIFKIPESTLQSLLMALNERLYDNGTDGVIDVPLWSMFCDSNEFPTSSSLDALYDRVHIRHVTDRIKERGNRIAMLKKQSSGPVAPTLTVAQLEQAHAEVIKVTIAGEVFDALAKIAEELYSDGIEITDRRLAMTLPLIQANAWFNGQGEATVPDMEPIRYMLWNRLDEISKVDHLVLNLASALEAEALEIRSALDNIGEEMERVLNDSDNKTARNKAIIAVHQRLDDAVADVVKLQAKASADGRTVASIEALANRADSMMEKLMVEGLNWNKAAK